MGLTNITLYGGPRFFDLTNVDADETDNYSPSLRISDGRDTHASEIRIFMKRAQLRELRDLLATAPLGEEAEYDVVYAAAIRAWEAV